ncbi:acyl thioesterase II [Fusarium beomiforme]|uniref:Acyl thioesterase II n=1 Tax=Fusarium beomiforme TaxID=44412 RepID=A0A9P5E269_9HYPO|nr:acyl thioesterase II [Fusarium beomiforme]
MESSPWHASSVHQVLRTGFAGMSAVDRTENTFTKPEWIKGVLYLPTKHFNSSNYGYDTVGTLKDYIATIPQQIAQIEEICASMEMQFPPNNKHLQTLRHRHKMFKNTLSQWESINKCLQGPLKHYNPNLILPPQYIPYRGLFAVANMETLYHLCCRLNDLQSLKTFGVHGELSQIQAFDFLRWRLGIVFSRLGMKSPEAFALVCAELVDGGLFSDEVMCFAREKVSKMEMRGIGMGTSSGIGMGVLGGMSAAIPQTPTERKAGGQRRSEDDELGLKSNRVTADIVDDSLIFG